MKITRRQLRRLILQEVRIKPDVTNIPPQHLDKIHDLIDMGELVQARSLIDAFGGSPDYVDDYIKYREVGNLEKLGNEAAAILSEPGYRHDDVQAVDQQARVIARKNMKDFEAQSDRLDAFYHSYYDRYAKNRNKVNISNPYHASYDPTVFLERIILESYDPVALARTRELYDMINEFQSELDIIQMELDEYIQREVAYGSDAMTARYDFMDENPEVNARARVLEMSIEDAYTEIESLGDLPYD